MARLHGVKIAAAVGTGLIPVVVIMVIMMGHSSPARPQPQVTMPSTFGVTVTPTAVDVCAPH